MHYIVPLCLALLLLFTSQQPLAATINGVDVAEQQMVNGSSLRLNGAGTRNKVFMKLYVASLYLNQKQTDAATIINGDQPMLMRLNITSGMITSKRMIDAIDKGFDNSLGENRQTYSKQIQSFMQSFNDPLKEGDQFDFIYQPGSGIEIVKNGKSINTITGLDFKKALFGIWLGEKPAQNSLKDNLLGH